jgi:signal transduction histidine kinase
MSHLRRLAPLIVSLGLVVALGAIGFLASAGANHKAEEVHRQDRTTLQTTLAGLGNQYLLIVAKEAFDFASAQPWSLRPGDPADRARLQSFVTHAAFLNHGAVLVDLARRPLNVYAKAPGLPPADDPGFVPMIGSLLARKPGFSSVMVVGGAPLVGVGVPVLEGGLPVAVLVGFFRADETALQTYNERLRYGKTGRGYLIDSQGGVIAGTDRSQIAQQVPSSPALAALAAGRSGLEEFSRDGTAMIVTYSPIGVGGWSVVTEQEAAEFFGPIRSGKLRVNLALIGLLAVAAAGLAVLNQKRQTALRRAYDYKGELLANTTHELKTPLTAIRGAAMTLGMRWRDMDAPQVDMFLGMIHRRCDGLSKLIEKILIGARLEAGREVPITPAPLEVAGLLRRIAAEFGDASPHHRIEVAVPAGAWVSADPQAVDQILGLLTENAIKYSPDGGEIRLEAEVRDADVLVRVTDSGIGMAEEDCRHAFEPYFKASRGDTQAFGGVGLGLSIARHLVHRHGGEIWVTSSPDVGSVFGFTLPRAEPPEQAAVLEPMVEVGR